MRPRVDLIALSLLVSVSVGRASDTRPAVVLYDPPPEYPSTALGSDVYPEATVRVTIDAEGKVTGVEVLAIDPSSPFDDRFESALKETLGQWRFAPRMEDGEEMPTELQWTTGFRGQTDRTAPLSRNDRWDLILGTDTTYESSILELPYEQRLELLESNVRAGLSRFVDGTATEHSSDWFVVRTDAGPEVAASVANNLEAVYGVLYRMFGDAIPLQSERLKVQAFIYESSSTLAELQSVLDPSETSFPGFYSQLGMIGMHLQLPTSEMAVEMLIHEGTHAFIDRHVLRPGAQLPYWLNEGFAEYMSNSTIKKGQLIPGRIPRGRRTQVVMVQGQVLVGSWDPTSEVTLDEIRQSARRGEALTLEQMLRADRAEFLGDRIALYYGMSWMLVHYLRHGQDTWAEETFPDLVLYMAEGYPALDAFETVYRTDVSALEEDFRRYIAEF